MIGLDAIKKIMEENEDRLPLLTLDEFFEGNNAEDSIAPNDWGFGRPPIAEIWGMLQKIERMPDMAWIRIALHDDTIELYNVTEEAVLYGDSVIICTSMQGAELEELVNCEWLCSGGAEEWELSSLDSIFSCRPPVPDGFRCFAIVWD
ncbi:MAG: hypothetical protein K2O91_12365 [Lachnospiraceae bacterium]|nr:hypothetical protein [Lachnospiraceae bacterium]